MSITVIDSDGSRTMPLKDFRFNKCFKDHYGESHCSICLFKQLCDRIKKGEEKK